VTKAEFIDRVASDDRIDSKKAAADAVEAVLDAVDPEVDDLALVPVGLEGAGHVFEAERLDEGDHLETEDAPGVWLEQRDLHGSWTFLMLG